MSTDKRQLELIRALSEAKAPSGFEDECIAAARMALADVCDIEEDSLRNLYFYRRRNSGGRPVVMLDAHSDEVGFMVHSVRPEGTLRFVQLGGWSAATLPGTKVLVRNADGDWLPGVIAAKPPHFQTAQERSLNQIPPLASLVIDVGATDANSIKNDFHIRIGEPIVPQVDFSYDEKRDVMFGKAFDCRIGCAALVEIMRRVAGLDLAVDVVGVLSSQEEVGERGCKVSVNRVRPDAAVCFEGCPADDTFSPEYAVQTALHGGPMLRFMDTSVICNPRFQRFSLELAEKSGIAVQSSVREGGGNDAAVIQAQLAGAPSIVAGVPVRYIHSANCITSWFDYDATVRLGVELLCALDEKTIKGF